MYDKDLHGPSAPRPCPPVADALAAWALGEVVFRALRTHESNLAIQTHVDSAALRALQEIQDVLNDLTLDDPDCFFRIEAVLDVFFRYHLPTVRHSECD